MSVVFESEEGERVTATIFSSGSSIKVVKFMVGTTTVELRSIGQDGNSSSSSNIQNISENTGTTNLVLGSSMSSSQQQSIRIIQEAETPELASPRRPDTIEPRRKQEEKEFINNMNGWLMTVATLLMSMAFQSGLSIPGGSWSDTSPTASSTQTDSGHTAGQPIIMSTDRYRYFSFLACDIAAFTCSVSIIILLLFKKSPEHRLVSIRSLLVYALVLIAIVFVLGCIPKFRYILAILPWLFVLQFLVWFDSSANYSWNTPHLRKLWAYISRKSDTSVDA